MEFSFNQSDSGITAELKIISGSATIVEDVAVKNNNGIWGVDKEVQYNLIDTILKMNRADGSNDVEFIKYMYENWLNRKEQEELADKITGNE